MPPAQVVHQQVRPVRLFRQRLFSASDRLRRHQHAAQDGHRQQRAADDLMDRMPLLGIVVQGDAVFQIAAGAFDVPGLPQRQIQHPQQEQCVESDRRRLFHPAHIPVIQSAFYPGSPVSDEKGAAKHNDPNGLPSPPVQFAQGLNGGELLGGVHVKFRRFTALRGPEQMELVPAQYILPAAVLIDRPLLRGHGAAVFLKSQRHDFNPVPGRSGFRPDELAQIGPPLDHPPALGLHITVKLLVFSQGIADGMKSVPVFHSPSSSRIAPSDTMLFSRWYSDSSAAFPSSVMA